MYKVFSTLLAHSTSVMGSVVLLFVLECVYKWFFETLKVRSLRVGTLSTAFP